MAVIAPWRLNLLRLGYLLLVVGLGFAIWPAILDAARHWPADRGVVTAMLAALSLLALIGLRHPLRMLPLLLWEVTWKAIWLLRIALPLWRTGTLDSQAAETASECLLAILIVAVIPWDHVVRTCLTGAGERWRRPTAGGGHRPVRGFRDDRG